MLDFIFLHKRVLSTVFTHKFLRERRGGIRIRKATRAQDAKLMLNRKPIDPTAATEVGRAKERKFEKQIRPASGRANISVAVVRRRAESESTKTQ